MNYSTIPFTPKSNTVGFDSKALPWYMKFPNTMADKYNLEDPKLTPENLTRVAARQAGLAATFPSHVEEALEVLCRSLTDEVNLHLFGRLNMYNLITTGLASLLQVEDAFRRDPSLAETKLIQPLVVTGLPRSGTTFLHRLLSVADDATSVALYQHMFPVVPRRFDTRRLNMRLKFLPWKMASKGFDMDAIHFVRPDLPDECNFGMRLGMRSIIFWAMAPVYSYLKWALGQDLRESYQLYRKVLLLHQRANPGLRITLKCPHHLAWLPALTEALPEADIVQTHRDPLQVVPSDCKLFLSLHGLSTRTMDWQQTVEHNKLKTLTYAQRAVEFADSPQGAKVLHIDYQGLVSDPVAVASKIHSHFGLQFTDKDRKTLLGFFSNNRQHKHGQNHYSLEQFDLSEDQLNQDFASYRNRFLDGH